MLQAIQHLIEQTSSRNRPWQVALAITLGLLTGLLPKTGLLCIAFASLTFLAPCHLPIAFLVAVIASIGSLGLADQFHSVGLMSLEHPQLVESWLRVDRLPIVPWLELQRPIVNGSMMIGMLTALPTFIVSLLAARSLASIVSTRRLLAAELAKSSLFRIDESNQTIRPPKFLSSPELPVSEAKLPAEEPLEIRAESSPAELDSDRALEELESILENCKADQAAGNVPGTEEVLARASQLTELVDQILQDYAESDEPETTTDQVGKPDSSIASGTAEIGNEESNHRRIDQAHQIERTPKEIKKDGRDMIDTPLQEPPKSSKDISREDAQQTGNQQLRVDSPEDDVIARQEEALRYLLNHLRGLHTEKSKRSANREK